MVKFKPLHGLLKVFKSKKTTNESLAGPRKLSRLSFNQIWRRLASSSSARTRAGESTITTKSSRSSYLGRLFRRRKQPVAANDLPSSSPEERNMPSSSDDCYGPLVFDHEVALSASITISSSLTTITRDTLTVSDDDDDDDDDSAEWESCNEDVLPEQSPIVSEMTDATAVAILANKIKGRINKIDHLLDEMRQTHLSQNIHYDLMEDKGVATPTQSADQDYSWFYRIWMLAVCVTFIFLLLL